MSSFHCLLYLLIRIDLSPSQKYGNTCLVQVNALKELTKAARKYIDFSFGLQTHEPFKVTSYGCLRFYTMPIFMLYMLIL
jgi:hypothetical protein